MAKVISLRNSEKLAILKIMLEINNIYDYRLPKGFKYIQDTATFLNIPDGIADACDMSIADAKDIITKFPTDFRDNFLLNRLGFLIMTSDYGVCKTLKQQFADPLVEPFVHEWSCVFELLNISERWRKFHVAKYHLMRHTRQKNNPSEEWIIYNSKKEDNITKPVDTSPTVLPQDSLKAEVTKEVETKQHLTNNIAPYSDAIKEILYKDL